MILPLLLAAAAAFPETASLERGIVFQLKPGASLADVALPAGVSVRRALPAPRGIDRAGVARVMLAEVDDVAAARAALAADPDVAWIDTLSGQCELAAQLIPNDTFFSFQWPLHQANDVDMDMPEVWAVQGFDAAPIVVAVIDTGFPLNTTEPDFAGSLWNNPLEIANGVDDDGDGFVDDLHGFDFVDGDANPAPIHDHGYWMASIIAARANNANGIAGVASGVKLMHLRPFDGGGGWPTSGPFPGKLAPAAAIVYAADHGARIANNSWIDASGPSPVILAACQYASDNGCLLVFGAGNDGIEFGSPSNHPEVIGVAGLSPDGKKWAGSNYGTFIDLSAGAESVPMLDPVLGGALAIGTSASTALVTGAAARLLTADGDLPRKDLKRLLELGAVSVDAANPAYAGKLGAGHVNVQRSLDLLKPFASAGAGVAGATAPVMNGYGGTHAGETFVLSISGGAPATPGVLVVGTSIASLPVLGPNGGILVPSPQIVFPIALDAAGEWRIETAMPVTLPLAIVAWMQALVADAGGPAGAAMTNALAVKGV